MTVDLLEQALAQDRLHPAINAMDLSLTFRPQGSKNAGFELSIANSAWGQKDFEFLATYFDTLTVNYGGEADYRGHPETARKSINNWVSEETNGRIEDLIPRQAITIWTRLVLANAIFFKAGWQTPCEERATRPGPFFELNGGEIRVRMMRQTEGLGYTQGNGYQAVELPCKDSYMAMTYWCPTRANSAT